MAPLPNITTVSPVGECGDSTLTKITSAVGIISFVLWAALLRISLRWWVVQEENDFPQLVANLPLRTLMDEWDMTNLQTLDQLLHKVDWQMDRLIMIHRHRRSAIQARLKHAVQMLHKCYETWSRFWFWGDGCRRQSPDRLIRFYSMKLWCWQAFGKPRMDKILAEMSAIQKDMDMLTMWTLLVATAHLQYRVLTRPDWSDEDYAIVRHRPRL